MTTTQRPLAQTGACLLGLLIVASCGGHASTTGSSPDASTDAATTSGCVSNADCVAPLPPTNPPDCAVAICDVPKGVCFFSAPDSDGDGYTAADCVSTSDVTVLNSGDCDDHNPNLYPGHPEPCTSEYDGGVDAGYCTTGQVSCLSNGMESVCSGTCSLCGPGAYSCAGMQPQQCNAAGTGWTNAGDACVAYCVNGACQGSCAPDTTRCTGAQIQACDVSGSWSAGVSCSTGEVCEANQAASGAGCAAGCFIGGSFVPPQNVNGDICQSCDPAASTSAWTNATDGTSCFEGAAAWGCCAGTCSDSETDPTNCGGCGRACTGGPSPTCTSGACSYTLASGQNYPFGIAVDSTNVYWTNDAGGAPSGTVMKAPVAGGVPTVLASGQTFSGIAVDSTNVYWLAGGSSGAVVKLPIAGGTATTLASGQNYPDGIAASATDVFWTNDDGTVMKVPIAGGTATTLASGQGEPLNIAVDAMNVYWTNWAGGTVMKVPIAGGTPTTLAAEQDRPFGIAVDATNVYWTNNGGTVMKMPVAGGTATMLASVADEPVGIAVDAKNVYWLTTTAAVGTTGDVLTVPIGGGSPTTLASGQNNPGGIAVNATNVYWTAIYGSTVMFALK